MNVQPTGIVELNHAAHYLTASDPPAVYVAASRDGQISVIGEDLKIHRHRRQRARISALTIDPAGKWIAVAFFRPERLVIERADSGLVFRDTTAQRFEECRFDTGGNCLWATVRIASALIRTTSGRLFLVDTGYMRLADEAVIVQPETPP